MKPKLTPVTRVVQLPGATADLSAASYCILDEDHTLGNLIRWMVMKKLAQPTSSRPQPAREPARGSAPMPRADRVGACACLQPGCRVLRVQVSRQLNANGVCSAWTDWLADWGFLPGFAALLIRPRQRFTLGFRCMVSAPSNTSIKNPNSIHHTRCNSARPSIATLARPRHPLHHPRNPSPPAHPHPLLHPYASRPTPGS